MSDAAQHRVELRPASGGGSAGGAAADDVLAGSLARLERVNDALADEAKLRAAEAENGSAAGAAASRSMPSAACDNLW